VGLHPRERNRADASSSWSPPESPGGGHRWKAYRGSMAAQGGIELPNFACRGPTDGFFLHPHRGWLVAHVSRAVHSATRLRLFSVFSGRSREHCFGVPGQAGHPEAAFCNAGPDDLRRGRWMPVSRGPCNSAVSGGRRSRSCTRPSPKGFPRSNRTIFGPAVGGRSGARGVWMRLATIRCQSRGGRRLAGTSLVRISGRPRKGATPPPRGTDGLPRPARHGWRANRGSSKRDPCGSSPAGLRAAATRMMATPPASLGQTLRSFLAGRGRRWFFIDLRARIWVQRPWMSPFFATPSTIVVFLLDQDFWPRAEVRELDVLSQLMPNLRLIPCRRQDGDVFPASALPAITESQAPHRADLSGRPRACSPPGWQAGLACGTSPGAIISQRTGRYEPRTFSSGSHRAARLEMLLFRG